MPTVARTTLTIDDDLLVRLKVRAAQRHMRLSQLVDEALRRGLSAEDRAGTDGGKRTRLPTWDLGGLQPGVTIGSLGHMLGQLDEMEVEDAAREGRAPRSRV